MSENWSEATEKDVLSSAEDSFFTGFVVCSIMCCLGFPGITLPRNDTRPSKLPFH